MPLLSEDGRGLLRQEMIVSQAWLSGLRRRPVIGGTLPRCAARWGVGCEYERPTALAPRCRADRTQRIEEKPHRDGL